MSRHQHRAPHAHRGGALAAAPWRRAPLLLLRQPSVFLAVVGAVAILSIAAASGGLFLSTLGTASLRAQTAGDCPEAGLPSVSADVSGPQISAVRAGGAAQFRAGGLRTPYTTEFGSATVQDSTVHLFSRPGALQHVQRLTPSAGAGVWVPDVFAHALRVQPGDTLTTRSGQPLRVAGIYRDMAPSPFRLSNLPRYWCSWRDEIVPNAASDQAVAATPINQRYGAWLITDEATVARASETPVTMSWFAPMPRTASLATYASGQRTATVIAARISSVYATAATAGSQLPAKIAIARNARNGLSGSVVPIDVAGVLVSLLLVGGAGMFWATHRAREVRLLVSRGVGPAALGAKAALETLIPALIGLVGGYFAAFAIVRAVGPADVFEPGTTLTAGLAAGAATAVGLALVGLIGALSARDRAIGAARSWLRLVPWELGLLGLAAWMGVLVRSGSGVRVDHTIVRVSPMAFVFPIVGSTAVLLLSGRLIAWALPRLGRIAHRTGVAGYLALRRLAGSRAVVVGLIVGTALPCCLLTYGSTVTHGVSSDVTTKYRTNLGAPHVLSVYGVRDNTLPDAQGHGTFVSIFQAEPRLPGGVNAYVLGIDPASFRRFAFLTSGQRAAVARLHDVTAGQPLPAILVNAAKGVDASSVSIRSTRLPLDVVARSSIFPGLRNGFRPMIVVDETALRTVDSNADREYQLWTSSAQLDNALGLLARGGYTVLTEITSDVVIGTTGLLPVTWIFGYLRALAILIGVIAIAGLVFALAARTRRRKVSYVLSRRMGLGKRTHLLSLILELLLVVGFGWLAGSGVGAGAFGVIYRSLDVYPALPPPISFVLPVATIAVTAAVTAIVVLAAALATQALAERARPAEILRLE